MSALLEATGLTKVFPVGGGFLRRKQDQVRAVDGVSLSVQRGETLGVVGESGCGKSTLARCLLRLTEPTSGSIRSNGVDVLELGGDDLRRYRRDVQIVFQDPLRTLTPWMTVEELLTEPLRAHGLAGSRRSARDRSAQLLELVGLSPEHASRKPYAFSGGQRQRIAIARALALEPRLLILDEPVTALDVSIAAQILNLLGQLQREFGVAYILISHDLSMIRQLADRVMVMYLGAVMESGETQQLFTAPQHPYTQTLLAAVPLPDPALERRRTRNPLLGEMPSSMDVPSGCRFHPRCPKAEPSCAEQEPPVTHVGHGEQQVTCWFPEPVDVLSRESDHISR